MLFRLHIDINHPILCVVLSQQHSATITMSKNKVNKRKMATYLPLFIIYYYLCAIKRHFAQSGSAETDK